MSVNAVCLHVLVDLHWKRETLYMYSTGETWYKIPDWRRDTRNKRPGGGRMEKWEDKWTRERDRALEKGE